MRRYRSRVRDVQLGTIDVVRGDRLWQLIQNGLGFLAVLIAIASDKGLIDIEQPVAAYLGAGWSKATPEQEAKIRVIDVLILTKNEDGTVDARELSDIDEVGQLQAIEAQLASL